MLKGTLVLALAVLNLIYQDAQGKLSGYFIYDNRQCKWMELTRNGPGPRSLAVNCPASKDGKKPAIGCQYRGNPHPCKEYNKDPLKYYQCLADTLGEIGDLCNINTVICKKMCSDIEFHLEKDTKKEDGNQTFVFVLVGIAAVSFIFVLLYFLK